MVSELVGSIKLVRAYVAEAFEAERFRRLADEYRKGVMRAQRFALLTSPVSEVFAGLVMVVIFSVGTRLAIGPGAALRPEVLIAFVAVALRLMSPVKSAAQLSRPSWRRRSRPRTACSKSSTCPTTNGIAPARVRRGSRTGSNIGGVSFAYETAKPRSCRTSTSTCGAGKWSRSSGPRGRARRRWWICCRGSTSRWTAPSSWTASRITQFTRKSLRTLMGIVSQETILLNDTVFANIAYGRRGLHAAAGRSRGGGGERTRLHQSASRRIQARCWESGARACREASASASRLPGRCCAIPRSLFSTRPPARSTPSRSGWCRRRSSV